jgi:hypothetical protein
MDKVFSLIDKYRDESGELREVWLYPPEDEQFIQLAERVLGHKLPEDYRRFVLTCSTASIFGLEIYGVFRNKAGRPDFSPGVPDAVGLTLEAREKHGLDDSTLWIAHLGDGEEVHLDMDGGGVYSWRPDGSGERLAASFGAWLLEQLEERETWWFDDDDDDDDDE